MTEVTINPDRVLGDLYHLRGIGTFKTGVHRPTLSAEDMQARRWLAEQLEALGYKTTIDGIANVLGSSPVTGRKLLAGSHLETQNEAGWLDGALGVVYALEAARVIAETRGFDDSAVDVIAFADEEAHFGGFLGSYSFVGELVENQIDAAVDRTRGITLRDALADAGLAGIERLQLQPDRYVGFLEAHIEQGDWLESSNQKIGVVTSIVAIAQYRITVTGAQNHAGTTRMANRRDAGQAAIRFCHEINGAFKQHAGDRTVWTVGKMTFDPGAPSIIPGAAEVIFQFRDAEPAKVAELEALLFETVQRINSDGPCGLSIETMNKSVPAVMHEDLQAALETAATVHVPGQHVRMPSGAGHDAQILARYLPAGMMFVPSIGGISHHYSENTSDEDIVAGAQVFASAAARILSN